MKLTAALISTGLLWSISPAISQTELQPKDINKMIEELVALQKQILAMHNSQHAVALQAYQGALSSPTKTYDFYLKCLEKVRFLDEGKRQEAWRVYQEENKETLRDPAHIAARGLQLRYIVLTIKAGTLEDRRSMTTDIITFLKDVSDMDAKGYGYLDEGIENSVFVKTYGIEHTIKPKDWETNPYNIEAIFDTAILPPLIEAKDARLATAWTSKIDLLTRRAEQIKLAREKAEREKQKEREREDDPDRVAEANEEVDQYEEFINEKLPELKWAMCTDLIKVGLEDQALVNMLSTVKAYPAHPGVLKWIESLEKNLKAKLEGRLLAIEAEEVKS